MRQVKNAPGCDLRNQFILFEDQGQLKLGFVLGFRGVSIFGVFDPTSLDVVTGDGNIAVMKLTEIQNAYLMMPMELVEYVNKSAEIGANAQDTLNKIYNFLETIKAG